jgi:hypothetical protein
MYTVVRLNEGYGHHSYEPSHNRFDPLPREVERLFLLKVSIGDKSPSHSSSHGQLGVGQDSGARIIERAL